MPNWMVLENADGTEVKEETKYEYDTGEVITVNSVSKYLCTKVKVVNGEKVHYFKEGIISFDW